MQEDSESDAVVLQARIIAFVRAFGLYQPDQTPCGQPLSVSEAHAVTELDRDGPLTQVELAGRLRLTKSTVSRLVDQLTARGWVQRRKRDGDGRLVWLELTDAGRHAAGELSTARAARFSSLLEAIPAGRRQTVVDALTLLVKAADEQLDQH
ncbi:MarR family winged helix-turn-helix transcriptional regulator [Pseudarthrobacter sp. J1738]|uniref:MarR family winged helix-turn-helix transcriptional regulator n=1 Tax=unclassified Pseudarthrobacter TaxID=2647000 RepID=UPI003D2AF0D5